MWYGKIVNGIVINKSCDNEVGYIEIPNWVTCGFTYSNGIFAEPLPIVPPVVIPQQVLAYQAKEALILSGIMPTQIETIINGLVSPAKELAMNQWLNAPTFKRYNSWISQLAPLIPLTDVQLDDLFVLAETL